MKGTNVECDERTGGMPLNNAADCLRCEKVLRRPTTSANDENSHCKQLTSHGTSTCEYLLPVTVTLIRVDATKLFFCRSFCWKFRSNEREILMEEIELDENCVVN